MNTEKMTRRILIEGRKWEKVLTGQMGTDTKNGNENRDWTEDKTSTDTWVGMRIKREQRTRRGTRAKGKNEDMDRTEHWTCTDAWARMRTEL